MSAGDSTVHILVAECTTVKEESKEENTDDPLSIYLQQGKSFLSIFCILVILYILRLAYLNQCSDPDPHGSACF